MLAGLQQVTFEFGARLIVADATWHIQPGERIGLIGYNGTGKSTLLKLLVGDYQPTAGSIERSRATSIGYLHQDLLSFNSQDSIVKVALQAFENILKLEQEIELIGKELEQTGDEKLLEAYTDKLHQLETADGYTIHHRTAEVLQGLGFSPTDLERPYQEFSGGWRMRVLLAKMILAKPDLLLLDEPTNHLDLPSIEWLEKYLSHYAGAVVIVSHDKYFLNRMVTKIVELYQEELHFYTGNYDFYQKEKSVRMELQQKAYENQQDYIRQQERLVERFRAKASKAAMAQSLLKKLDKLERVDPAQLVRPNLKINFSVDRTPGKIIATLKNVKKSFGQLEVMQEATAEINRGDKIALIGANGKGKSTLLRILAGTEPIDLGEKTDGHNVVQSFYAQHQLESLTLSHTLLEEMASSGSQLSDLEIRSLLGCFLFSGDDVDKKIKVLSGGEKARVALAKVITSRANFLLLDEPTNHLDLHSCELLIEALQKYEGTLILVSHDRYFISKTANKIWEIEDGILKEFKGGYEEWVSWKERMEKQRNNNTSKAAPILKTNTTTTPPANTSQPISKEKKKEYQKAQKQFQQAEQDLAAATLLQKELEKKLADPRLYSNREDFLKLEIAYQECIQSIKLHTENYEQLFEAIMKLEE
ncbi:MAG: ABC-F family ATP-binding cassette domain-containing protein [Bacteroidetes bacterium]|nr:ABC-F family ATP-binding cassette domain-containing protein [Bacteroidota bacterium]